MTVGDKLTPHIKFQVSPSPGCAGSFKNETCDGGSWRSPSECV